MQLYILDPYRADRIDPYMLESYLELLHKDDVLYLKKQAYTADEDRRERVENYVFHPLFVEQEVEEEIVEITFYERESTELTHDIVSPVEQAVQRSIFKQHIVAKQQNTREEQQAILNDVKNIL